VVALPAGPVYGQLSDRTRRMSHADWPAPSQRGKISGIAGFLAALGPIIGSVPASAVSRNDLRPRRGGGR